MTATDAPADVGNHTDAPSSKSSSITKTTSRKATKPSNNHKSEADTNDRVDREEPNRKKRRKGSHPQRAQLAVIDDVALSPGERADYLQKICAPCERQSSRSKAGSAPHPSKGSIAGFQFPYPTDYNDHFETPQRAYADIYPLLQICLQKDKKSNNKEAVIYDPYFCTGTAATLMEQTFKSNKDKSPLPCPTRIHHKKADFYVDVKQNKFPQYDILVTNPPYSSNHKERCLEFAVNQLKKNGRPFFLLMPNYVSTKEYWRKITQNIQVVFIAPSTSHPYEYNHPEGTGHEKSPFESVWFCGVSGNEDMKALKDAFIKFHSKHTSTPIPRWAESLQGLIQVGGVSGEKRKNPRQRKKMRLLAMQKSGAAGPSPSSAQVKNTALPSSGQNNDSKPKKKFDRRKQNSDKKTKKKRLNSGNDR